MEYLEVGKTVMIYWLLTIMGATMQLEESVRIWVEIFQRVN